MAEQANRALVERYFEEVRNGRSEAAGRQVFAPDVAVHVDTPSGPEVIRGLPAIRQALGEYASGIADLRFTIEDLLVSGDHVVVRWRARGTHRGELHGIAATGRSIAFGGIDIFRVADGKISEGWSSYDRLSILQQIGALPAAGHAPR